MNNFLGKYFILSEVITYFIKSQILVAYEPSTIVIQNEYQHNIRIGNRS